MRPRVFPAEDSFDSESCSFRLSRFNEAAGIPRGRQVEQIPERAKAILIELQ